MSGGRGGSGTRGIGTLRRFIRQMPEVVEKELRTELDDGGRIFRSTMQARAPKLTGATRAGISYRVLPKSLRLRIGLIGTPRGRAKLFYARIQDLGRKAQVVYYQRRKRGTAKRLVRGRKPAADLVAGGKFYRMRVRAMPGKQFVSGRMTEARVSFGRRLLKAYERGVAIALRGVRP